MLWSSLVPSWIPLRLRLFVGSSPTPVPSEPVLTSHRALAQELADKCKRQEKLQTQLSEQRTKVAEEEGVLERMQADLVGLVGEKFRISMKKFLSCGGRFLWFLSRRIWMPAMGQPLELLCARSLKRGLLKGKKVKILTDSSTKILKLAQGLSHGDLLKLAKRLGMALDSGSNAASCKNIDTNVQNLDDEEDVELSMTYG